MFEFDRCSVDLSVGHAAAKKGRDVFEFGWFDCVSILGNSVKKDIQNQMVNIRFVPFKNH